MFRVLYLFTLIFVSHVQINFVNIEETPSLLTDDVICARSFVSFHLWLFLSLCSFSVHAAIILFCFILFGLFCLWDFFFWY